MTQTVQHPAFTSAVQRGRPSSAPNGEPIDDEGFFEVADEDAAIDVMDQLASTYGVAYDDENAVVESGGLPTAADVTFDARDVDGVGDALAARLAERNDTLADLLTGTEDQQPEERLAEIDGIDADLAADITQTALDASADNESVSEASIDVVTPDEA